MTPQRKALVFALVLGAIAVASFIFFLSGGLELLIDALGVPGLAVAPVR